MTGASPQAAPNFGRTHPNHAARYAIAAEYVEVVRGLWDCWADDALLADRRSGRYIDPARLRPLDHAGPHFAVQGPLNISRSPQGQPVILQAGGSPAGLALAAASADVVFSVVQDFAEARSQYAALKTLLPAHGRKAADLAVLPGVMPVIGRTEREATEKLALLQSFVDASNARQLLSDRLGIDLRSHDLDAPLPDVPVPDTYHSFARAMLNKAGREGLNLRDLYNLVAAARGHWVLCGTPESVADTLRAWFEGGAADGFNVMPPDFPEGLRDFTQGVVPILQERGLFRRAYAGPTLRDHLGLARPARRPV